jgi:hypothetical protein
MIELKKQTAGQKAAFDGTKQFRETRDPSQLVFSFNKRTLAYFAMDEMVAFVTTQLDRKDTRFLPYNMGSEDEGAGNPVTPGKHCTYYIWEQILQKDISTLQNQSSASLCDGSRTRDFDTDRFLLSYEIPKSFAILTAASLADMP